MMKAPALLAIAIGAAFQAAAVNWSGPAGRDFPLVGGNWGNQRYSALDRINTRTIGSLGAAWTLHLEDGRTAGNMQATPVVAGGVMFISSGPGNVFAIDAKTGAVKWTYRSESKVGSLTSRGVAAAEGM